MSPHAADDRDSGRVRRPAEEARMLLGAICEACRQPMSGNVTNVQLVTGELVQAGMTASLRGTRSPESYNLCSHCSAQVYGLLHSMTRGVPAGSAGVP